MSTSPTCLQEITEHNPMPELADLRILLIQARNTEDIRTQEQECFREHCRVRADQITAVKVQSDPLDADILNHADAVMIGGAGEYSATMSYPWMPALTDLIRRIADRGMPAFGSCWGHQIIAGALGGRVIHDSALAEIGCGPMMLTEAGKQDPVFGNFPERFLANMGHHDRVSELPPGAVELVVSETQGNQAFRMGDLPIYGTQFHSELDASRMRERFYRYRWNYPELADEETFHALQEGLAETTEVDNLLHDFLMETVIGR